MMTPEAAEGRARRKLPVEVESLSHYYGERHALKEISFSVERGEIFGFLGPNGGGKTTLFHILSTYILPSGGHATIFGEDVVLSPAAARAKMGVVFQSPSLDKMLTAEENLMHQGHLYGLSGADLISRIEHALVSVGLESRAKQRVSTFSGGMQRRVEIAKALLHRPELLLLDEPGTGLDPGARREVWQQLQSLKADGVTCLLTTHLMDEAEKCDRLAILHHGKIVAQGTPDQLKAVVGGEVLTLESREPEALRHGIAERFGGEPAVFGDSVRIEAARIEDTAAPALLVSLIEAFPGQIQSAKLGKPTLEDAFVHLTGSGFHQAESTTETHAKRY